jgi:hypothetical protein
MNFKFLKPQWSNLLLSLIVMCSPFIRESAPSAGGGVSVVFYKPIYLLAAYIQMNEHYALFLMVCFTLFVYTASSVLVEITKFAGEKVFKKRKKKKK